MSDVQRCVTTSTVLGEGHARRRRRSGVESGASDASDGVVSSTDAVSVKIEGVALDGGFRQPPSPRLS